MEKDLTRLKKIADAGDVMAMSVYASCCSMDKDYANAEKYLRMAAEEGCDTAMRDLARLYISLGKKEKAGKYLAMAAEAGSTYVLRDLALIYQELGEKELAEKCLRQAVEGGYIIAFYDYAEMLESEGNTEEAMKWYMEAVSNGYSPAVEAATRLFEQTGTETERKMAAALRKMAAEEDYLSDLHEQSGSDPDETDI